MIHPPFNLSLRILSYVILLVPNVYIISGYVIVIIVVSGNIYTVLTGKDSADASKLWFVLLLVIKFVYTLVPILVAMGVSNLVSILKFLGALVIFYNFVIPLLLQLTSQRLCYKTFWQILQSSYDLNDSSHENSRLVPSVKPSDLYMTPYSNIFSHWPVVAVIGVMTVLIFVFTVMSSFY